MFQIHQPILLSIAAGCSDYQLHEDEPSPAGLPTASAETTPTTTSTSSSSTETTTSSTFEATTTKTGTPSLDTASPGDTGTPPPKKTEAFCTPFDDFGGWSYLGDGNWTVDSGELTENRAGYYASIAYTDDLGSATHFRIEATVGWQGSLNDLTGLVWGLDTINHSAYTVRWDDPQGDYGRHDPTGGMDLAFCEEGVCNVIVADDTAALYWPADRSLADFSIELEDTLLTVEVNGSTVLSTDVPDLAGTGPGRVGIYSNDNDGGIIFSDYCVWIW